MEPSNLGIVLETVTVTGEATGHWTLRTGQAKFILVYLVWSHAEIFVT